MARMCDPTLSVRLGVFVGSLGTWLGLQLVSWLVVEFLCIGVCQERCVKEKVAK